MTRSSLRSPILLGALALLAACSGGGDGTPTPPQTPTLAVSASVGTGTAARGASASFPLTITRGGGFTGAVTLTAEGVPTGVTASFAPASLATGTTSSTLTLTSTATAAPGTHTVTVRATGTGLSAQTTVSLTVPTPAITLVAGSATASLVQGATATVPLTITRTNGFSGPVTIAVDGLPSGVTAALAPASPLPEGTTATTLTLSATSAATVGPATLTVRASGTGVTEQTATIALNVTAAIAPGFTLAAAPATITAVAGQGGTSTLTLARQGGFAGDVALTVTGAPAGVTTSFAPATLSGAANTSTLTVASTSATTPGTYNLVVRANASGQAERTATIALTINAAPGITLALAPSSVSATQGATVTTTVTLARVGGFTGDVTFAATGLPTGATATFAPAVAAGAVTSSVLSLAAGSATPAGTYTVTVSGTGAGGITASAPVTFTVSVPQGVSLAATNATTAPGGTATSTLTLTRTGGFAGGVTLAVSGLPAGVTATFAPQPATGTSSTLSLTVPASIGAGTYTGTITGTASGVTIAPVTFTLTVTGGGGGGNVAYRFCAQDALPTFFAFRNGSTGAWTTVTRDASNSYTFALTANVAAVAYATPNGNGTSTMTVQFFTAAEFRTLAAAACQSAPPTKSVTGTVAGLANNATTMQSATISLGGGLGTVSAPNTTFTIPNATLGVTDLLAARTSTDLMTGIGTVDRLVLRRAIDPPAGGSIGPVLDFGSVDAFAPTTATYTVANAGADQLFAFSTFRTANGLFAPLDQGVVPTGNTLRISGVPAARLQAGDLHQVYVGAVSSQGGVERTRAAFRIDDALTNRTITLGPAMPTPTFTAIETSPELRVRAAITVPTEYESAVTVQYQQDDGRVWLMSASRAYLEATSNTAGVRVASTTLNATLEQPMLRQTPGYSASSLGLRSGVSTRASVTGSSYQEGTLQLVAGLLLILSTILVNFVL